MRLIHPSYRNRKAHLLAGTDPEIQNGEQALCGMRIAWHAVWTVVGATHVPLCATCARRAAEQPEDGACPDCGERMSDGACEGCDAGADWQEGLTREEWHAELASEYQAAAF